MPRSLRLSFESILDEPVGAVYKPPDVPSGVESMERDIGGAYLYVAGKLELGLVTAISKSLRYHVYEMAGNDGTVVRVNVFPKEPKVEYEKDVCHAKSLGVSFDPDQREFFLPDSCADGNAGNVLTGMTLDILDLYFENGRKIKKSA